VNGTASVKDDAPGARRAMWILPLASQASATLSSDPVASTGANSVESPTI
jgi:hypothetical protein